jgi:septal ring-binding cell division protein DamX
MRNGGNASETEAARDAKPPWDESMRRFVDSIDVRLDILEEELGGLQDELNRLQQAAREGADAAQRRLARIYAAGQVLLALLIIVLFLKGWPAGGRAPGTESSPPAVPTTPTPAPETGSATTPKSPEQPPTVEESTGAGTESVTPSAPNPEEDQPAVDAPEQPLSPQGQGTPALVPADTDPAKSSSGSLEPKGQDQADAASPPASATEGQTSPAPAAESLASTPGDGEPGPPPAALQPVEPDQTARSLPAENREEGGDPRTSAPASAVPPAGGTPSPPDRSRIVLDEEGFAIQLISYRSVASLPSFVTKFGIADEARYMHSQAQNQDWYPVLLGVYRTRAEGLAAVDALPPPLRALNPWVRSLPAGTELVPVGAPADVASNE